MFRLLKVEYYRTTHRLIFIILAGVMLFCAVTGTFNLYSQAQGLYVKQMQGIVDTRYEVGSEEWEAEYDILWKQVYAQTFTGHNMIYFLIPGVLSFALGADLKKRRVSEMIAAGNTKGKVFWAKSLSYISICAFLPIVCGSINFWINTSTYAGHIDASDIGFLLYTIGYMVIFNASIAAWWLPMYYLTGEPISGLLCNFFFSSSLFMRLQSIFPHDSYNHPSGAMFYYFTGDVAPEWGQVMLLVTVILGLISLIATRLIFQKRALK